jgi:hypothetical protein
MVGEVTSLSALVLNTVKPDQLSTAKTASLPHDNNLDSSVNVQKVP